MSSPARVLAPACLVALLLAGCADGPPRAAEAVTASLVQPADTAAAPGDDDLAFLGDLSRLELERPRSSTRTSDPDRPAAVAFRSREASAEFTAVIAVGEALWDRILLLGAPGPPADLGLVDSGRRESAFGHEFAEWVARDDAAPLRALWWNDAAGLTLRCRMRPGRRELVREVVSFTPGVDAAGLRHPAERHPAWLNRELSDWHDSCGDAAGAHEHGDHAHAGDPGHG